MARTDPLTQLLNRRALLTQLGTEVERTRRYNAPLSILMIDVDEFKDANDTLATWPAIRCWWRWR